MPHRNEINLDLKMPGATEAQKSSPGPIRRQISDLGYASSESGTPNQTAYVITPRISLQLRAAESRIIGCLYARLVYLLTTIIIP